jgi:hypothetical protein
MILRARVAMPEVGGPSISVRRPRGMPPLPARARSSVGKLVEMGRSGDSDGISRPGCKAFRPQRAWMAAAVASSRFRLLDSTGPPQVCKPRSDAGKEQMFAPQFYRIPGRCQIWIQFEFRCFIRSRIQRPLYFRLESWYTWGRYSSLQVRQTHYESSG